MDLVNYPAEIMKVLEQHAPLLQPAIRTTMVKALILMRNRDFIDPTTLLPLFFKLFRCHDKPLRTLLHTHIVSDIRNTNKKRKSNRLNRVLQSFLYTVVQDKGSAIAAKKSLDVMIELYHRNIWYCIHTTTATSTTATVALSLHPPIYTID
jgi:protein SDA1